MTPDTFLWWTFSGLASGAMAVDALAAQRRAEPLSLRRALAWTGFWVLIAALFAAVIYLKLGLPRALEYSTAYVVEEALSVDNMFVFVLIFSAFGITSAQQPRILKWGIIGAIAMRLVLILSGSALLHRFHWLTFVFGAILLITAIRMVVSEQEQAKPEDSRVLRWVGRWIPVMPGIRGDHFFVFEDGRWWATRLFAALLVIESSDLLFAVDSIPAVLAISKDTLVVFSSNVFAVLGLRSLYFVIQGFLDRFRFLRYGLALVLAFIGSKMLLSPWWTVSILWSLGAVLLCLTTSMLVSVLVKESPND